jgi:hypothetical protein
MKKTKINKKSKKRAYIFSLTAFLIFAFTIKIFLSLNSIDKSNYILDYKEMNYLIEYCKLKDERILTNNNFTIIQINPYLIAKKNNKTYYINCS